MAEFLCGDAAEQLKTLADESVNMCVTSPPYYGLRDYGESGQIGIEQTPGEYIARLVKVFDEVHRVLKNDGTLWLNIGDSYAGSGKGPMTISKNGKNENVFDMSNRIYEVPKKWEGIKPKDLIGVPWLLAFALRDRGWYLRSDIIWHKLNCLPESVKDRPTKTYEHIFLLSKSPKYYYDYKAIQEPLKQVSKDRYKRGRSNHSKYSGQELQQNINRQHTDFSEFDQEFRRKRDVWEVSTNTYKMDEHFAMFPEKLIEPCILAGSAIGGVVLDPFFGSGTTGAVAKRYGRDFIGIDLNARYLEKAKLRIDEVICEI
ncbi:MAG: site-specific DNA-methyltransferase [Roseburia sp.]|nr:site-specific DNA-methyltransferase [Roseburia sp.]